MSTLDAWLTHIDDDEERRAVVALAERVHAQDAGAGRGSAQDASSLDALLTDIRQRLAWSLRAKRHPLPGLAELRAAIRRHFETKT